MYSEVLPAWSLIKAFLVMFSVFFFIFYCWNQWKTDAAGCAPSPALILDNFPLLALWNWACSEEWWLSSVDACHKNTRRALSFTSLTQPLLKTKSDRIKSSCCWCRGKSTVLVLIKNAANKCSNYSTRWWPPGALSVQRSTLRFLTVCSDLKR